jgi:hypothetical protein
MASDERTVDAHPNPAPPNAASPPAPVSARRRRTNDQVLAVLAEHGSVTRADLSRLTGLSRSAVGTAGPGRRPTVVALRHQPGIVLAVDFEHAHPTAAIVHGHRLNPRHTTPEAHSMA